MDKLYLGQENDGEVDDLLAQLNDESILKLSVDTHVTTDSMRGSLPDDEDLNSTVEGIDPELAARYASLKAPRPRGREKGKASGKSKPGNAQPGDMSASSKRSSKGVYILEQPGNLARSNSADSDSVDSLDAELIARLLALKSPSVPQQVTLCALYPCSDSWKEDPDNLLELMSHSISHPYHNIFLKRWLHVDLQVLIWCWTCRVQMVNLSLFLGVRQTLTVIHLP